MNDRRVSVFEALNHTRKEILVGLTSSAIPESSDRRTFDLPGEVAHWDPAESLSVRRLADNIPLADAWQFVELYAFYIDKGDWKIIRQSPADGVRP